MTETEKLPKPMSATERREIRRIMEKEFELLHTELQTKSEEIRHQMREDVKKKFEPLRREAERAAAKLKKEAEKVEEKLNALVAECREKGVKPTNSMSVKVNISPTWEPIGLQEALANVDHEVRQQLAEARAMLKRQEVDFDKQLSLNAIVSAEAQEFVAAIPKASDVFKLDPSRVVVAIESAKKKAS